jgi:hypothetical protein
LKVKLIDQLSTILIKEICKIFEDEIESMSKMALLPDGAVQYQVAREGDTVYCMILRPKYLLTKHTMANFVPTVSALPKSQKLFYVELLKATAIKIFKCDDSIKLALNSVEKQVSLGQGMYDYSISEIVKSKVAATVMAAVKKNPKVEQLFLIATATPPHPNEFKNPLKPPVASSSSSSASSSSTSTLQAQSVKKVDPKELRCKLIDQLSTNIINVITKVFSDEINLMANTKPLPEGAIDYPLNIKGNAMRCIALRPKYLLTQHTMANFVATVSAFPKSQKLFYAELLLATAKKVNTCSESIVLALTLIEKQVSLGQGMYDYALSEIVKSMVAATVMGAVKKNPKIEQHFV